MVTKTFEATVESAWGDEALTKVLKEKYPQGLKYSACYDAPQSAAEVEKLLGAKFSRFIVKAGEARAKAAAKQTAMAEALTAAGFPKPEAAALSPWEIAVAGLVKAGIPRTIAEQTADGHNLSKEKPVK